MMGLKKEDYNEVEAHIVGGSDMSGIKINANKKTIGQMNVEAANEELLKCGFKISSQDCGGKEARQVIVDCSTGLIRVIKFTRGKKDHAS
jgi:chemotaxis receptor (MCP) glutamine deamidase CheD